VDRVDQVFEAAFKNGAQQTTESIEQGELGSEAGQIEVESD
jgi:hypothetical protein